MTTNDLETEVKIRVGDLPDIQSRLQLEGFRAITSRTFEANIIYDTPQRTIRARGMLLRLREYGDRAVITWKGPDLPGRHKSRPELETSIGSAHVLGQILEHLGYEAVFRYEKFRTELSNDTAGSVTLDETPIGNFVELEGPPDWIDRQAAELGFSPKDYVLESYGALYQQFCRNKGLQPQNMTFASNE